MNNTLELESLRENDLQGDTSYPDEYVQNNSMKDGLRFPLIMRFMRTGCAVEEPGFTNRSKTYVGSKRRWLSPPFKWKQRHCH